MWAAIKQFHGGGGPTIRTIPSATALVIPDNEGIFFVSGTTTIATVTSGASQHPRIVVLIVASGAGPITFTNDDAPAAGEMDLGGSNRILEASDVLTLLLKDDSTWLRIGAVDNTDSAS